MKHIGAFKKVFVCWLCVVSVWVGVCNAQTIITGSGTLSSTSFDEIKNLYSVQDSSVTLNYAPSSLSQLRTQFAQGNVDYIITQAPLLPAEHTQDECSGSYDVREFPMNVDGLIVIYSIPGIDSQNASVPVLILDRQTLVGIYSGTITKWNDPSIVNLNPNLAPMLPSNTITPYYIEDSSLSQVFSAALSSFSATWRAQQESVGLDTWPYSAQGIANGGGVGNDDMLKAILADNSSIGFIQYAATTIKTVAQIKNRAGSTVAYSAGNVRSAANDFLSSVVSSLNASEARPADYPATSLVIVDGPGQNSWPFAFFNMLTTRVKGFSDCVKASEMIQLIQFISSNSQLLKTWANDGFASLPGDIVAALNTLGNTIRCCQSTTGAGSKTTHLQGQGSDFSTFALTSLVTIFNTLPVASYPATISYSSSPSSVSTILGNSANSFAISTSPPSDPSPNWHTVKLFGGAVVCVYNANEISNLSLSHDEMVGIFTGTITNWNQLASATSTDNAINVIFSADPDVSTIFINALALTGVSFTASTQDQTLQTVLVTNFSIGIVGFTPAASSVSVASFTASDGSVVSPSNNSAILASFQGATSGAVWPITSYSYITFNVDSNTYCPSAQSVATFIYWTSTDTQALSALQSSFSVRSPDSPNVGSALNAITCSSAPILIPLLVIPGEGSTFAASVYQSWLSSYAFVDNTAEFTYNPTGSGAGIAGITKGGDVWAGSDAPLTPTQASAGVDLQLYPAFAGSVVLAYRVDNLAGQSTQLRFTRQLIVDIFLGNVNTWNDPAIAAVNPELASLLPAAPITLVYRLDSSGTTNIFTTALKSFSPSWTITPGTLITWPVQGQKSQGSDGVGERIFSTANSLGYVELSYASLHGLSYGQIQNKAGNWVSPSSDTVQSAMNDFADAFSPDFTCNIVDGKGANSWPLAAYTYFILHTTTMTDLATARDVLEFFKWGVTSNVGSQRVTSLGFTPLPATFVTDKLLPKLSLVKVNGVSVLGLGTTPKSSNNKALAVGLGVGLGLGLPLILIIIALLLYTRSVKRRKIQKDIFSIEASEWADEGEELQPLTDSMGIRLGNGAELLRFGIMKGARFPVMQTMIEKITLTNESSSDKNFAFYVPRDDNRFKLVVVPGYGVLKPGDEMVVEVKFTLLMTTTLDRKVKFEVLGCGAQGIPLRVAGDVSTRLDPNEIDILGKPIGQGAFGTVYKGTYRGTQVAVKVLARQNELLKAQTDEFLKEIDLMHRLRSPFIVGFVGASYVPGKLCVLTEFMEKGSVAHMLRKIKLEHVLRLKIALDCAHSIAFLHNNGVMHRDLKPANLLVMSLSSSAEVTIKLADFGTSRTCTQIYADNRYTNGWGTPGYMAPELLSRGEYSGKVDVYAFGIMLLELFTQKDPFGFLKKIWDLPDYIVGGNRPEIPAECPADYAALMTKCWSQDPSERPSFPELEAALEPLYATERVRAKDAKRKMVEAGITPLKPAYENGTYVARSSANSTGPSSAAPHTSNTQTQGSVHLSDFSMSEAASTNDPHRYDHTKSYDPSRSPKFDHTRSIATSDAFRAMLSNPLGLKGKEKTIGVSGGDMERLTSFANLSSDNISKDRKVFFTENKDEL